MRDDDTVGSRRLNKNAIAACNAFSYWATMM
jgi:hypothetical protein